MRRLLLGVIALVCCLPLAAAVPSPAAAAAETAGPSVLAPAPKAAPVATKQAAAANCYLAPTPTCGINQSLLFNSATGSTATKNRILNHLIGAINHTRPGGQIFIMSWNVMSKPATTALINAQRRGVQVLVLMDAINVSANAPNPQWRRLVRSLAAYNKYFPATRRSYAKACQYSCRRGVGGSAHSKFYLFSQVGKTSGVVMHGSANLTTASATNQWNDLFTFTGNAGIYLFAKSIFYQMFQDKAVYPSYRYFKGNGYGLAFSPRIAPNGALYPARDMLETKLAQTTCTGAVNGNRNHRTVIRAFPDVIRGKWGDRIARQLKRLWNQGCDVKVGYTILGSSTGAILKAKSGRGPVPLRHMVVDRNGDKVFDKYFHLKAWTINGVVNGDRNVFFTMHGSSNISDNAAVSDENIGWFYSPAITRAFQNHMDYWFANPPRSRAPIPSLVPKNLDPYANMEKDY